MFFTYKVLISEWNLWNMIKFNYMISNFLFFFSVQIFSIGRRILAKESSEVRLPCKFVVQVSISPTFYAQLFVQKCFVKLFSNLSLALVFFVQRILAKKATHKMLVNLTPGVNFIQHFTRNFPHTKVLCTAFL